ncbi:hypothetical protein GCM10027022_01840 [Alpinimonas psychrophila]|uniref:Multidrug ABC transporter ATPase n=1 Tax=Alpinimonas psychrophila TaxID=748908 RepID=A0A7W3JRP7_9MICO|nr:hypothetical protein [Alpinimonas psychrophila]MBA8827993.1 hypothetical protein [Alpinimonas psychrophila]
MAIEETPEASRPERVLATMVAVAVGLSVLCFFGVMLAGPLGYSLNSQFGYFITAFPLVGLPLGFLLLLSLLIVNGLRRKRSSNTVAR